MSVISFLSWCWLLLLTIKLNELYLSHSNQVPGSSLVTGKLSLKTGCFSPPLCELTWQVSFIEEERQPKNERASFKAPNWCALCWWRWLRWWDREVRGKEGNGIRRGWKKNQWDKQVEGQEGKEGRRGKIRCSEWETKFSFTLFF